MNRKTIIATFCSLIILVALVAAVAFLTGSRKASQFVTLPDGTRLSIRAVTYKASHEVASGFGWRDKFFRALPLGVSRKLGAKVNTFFTGRTNAMVLWFNTDPRFAAAPYSFAGLNLRAVALDEYGMESSESYVSGVGNTTILATELDNFSRRSREFKIRLYSFGPMGQLSMLGDLNVINRFPATAPGWIPETLPATRETNGLTITLLNFETGRGPGVSNYIQGRENTQAFFDLTENGKRATNWGISKLHFDSAASGPFEPGSYGSGWRGSRFFFICEAALWSEEPAWKITAEAWRFADFPSNEVWVLTNIAVPEPGRLTEMRTATNIYGATVEVLGISTAGAIPPNDWGERMVRSDKYSLHVTLSNPPPDVHLNLASVQDETGKQVFDGGYYSSSTGSNSTQYAFTLHVSDRARSINVTLALSKSRNVEFFVKPTFTNSLPTNVPARR